MIYVPYGFVVSEKLSSRCSGLRVGALVRSPADPEAAGLMAKQVESLKAAKGTKMTEVAAKALEDELNLVEKMVKALGDAQPPAPPAV